MRVWLAVAASALLLVPGAAAQTVRGPQASDSFQPIDAHPAECARLARQIDHFETMAARARQLGNALWFERTQNHVDLLKGMQAARCPGDLPVDTTGRAFKQLLRLAAKAAITYFTFGAGGF
jgi:hypothetical protein